MNVRMFSYIALFVWLLLLSGCGGGSNRQAANPNSNGNVNSLANTVAGRSVTDNSGGTQSSETDTTEKQVSNPPYIPHGKANTVSTASQYPTSNAASHPYSSSDPPEIWLEFPKPKQVKDDTLNHLETIRVDLSADAKYTLRKYWYDLGTMTPTSGQREFNDGIREVRDALLKTQIDAPDGRRNLAADEADSVLQTMHGAFTRLRRNGKQD